MQHTVFLDIGIILIAATIVVLFARRFKQPLIPAYIFAGILLGPGITYLAKTELVSRLFSLPAGFTVIANHDLITTLSEVGIALLLFIVGLEINLKSFKEVEKVTSLGATINILLMLGIGFLFSQLFGFTGIESVYIAFVFVFSSTMVLVKILSDRKEIDSLHGKIMVGFLLMEDIVAIFALFILTSIGNFSMINMLFSLALGVVVIIGLVFLSNLLLPSLFRQIANSKEMLFLTALGFCFFFSLVFSSFGLSIVIGSFVAGIILGNLPFNYEIIGRVRPLRDFFATLFFVSLGMQLQLNGLMFLLPFFLGALAVIIIVKPLLTMIVVGTFGYRKYTSFKVGSSFMQISEFSLILISQGMLLGFVSSSVFSIVVLLSIVTITLTSYIMQNQLEIYNKIKDQLGFLEMPDHFHKTQQHYKKHENNIVLCGCDRIGRSILTKLMNENSTPLVVDYNPKIVAKLKEQDVPVLYGDITNDDVLGHINFRKVKVLINTIRKYDSSRMLIEDTKRMNKSIVIIECADRVQDALKLYECGADYVILPHFLSGDYIAYLLSNTNKSIMSAKRKSHINELIKHQSHFLEDTHLIDEHHNHI